MMAAGRAGELGARVVLIEKNKNLGVKLLTTGGGRCNLTNKISDPKQMAVKFEQKGKFLISPLYKFGPEEMIAFLEKRGLKTKTEANQRVFPASNKATDVLKILINYLKEFKVNIKTNAKVKKIIKNKNKIEKIILENREEIEADKFIFSVGGKSYPQTGSTGDGYDWLRALGHTIVSPKPSLTPIVLKEKFIKDLEGLSLKDVEIKLYKNNKKIEIKRGEAIFTSDGMSGPVILDLSRKISGGNNEIIKIDFIPDLDPSDFEKNILQSFQRGNNKLFKNILLNFAPSKLIPIIINLLKIGPDKKANMITKEERKSLINLLKNFILEVKELAGYNRAMITSGGPVLTEIDSRTMKSKIVDNLYFAGEILGLNGPTGGYNLQVCWTTGYVAGESAAKMRDN